MAPASANFGFLAGYDPLLAKLPSLAERYFADDPGTALMKLRQFCEELTKQVAAHAGEYTRPDEDLLSILRRLEHAHVLPRQTASLLHGLRKAGNAAVHDNVGTHGTALHQPKMARQLAIWFHRTYGGGASFKPGPFVPPRRPEDTSAEVKAELERLKGELDAARGDAEQAAALAEEERRRRASAEEERDLIQEMAAEVEQQLEDKAARIQQLEVLQAHAEADKTATQEKIALGRTADETIELTEAETRQLIDEQLRGVGWEADTDNLRYERGTRPQKGRNMAIAEWPTASGPVDYALFCGLKCVALVEAKRFEKDVPGVLQQAKRYGEDMQVHDAAEWAGGPWGKYKVPFLYATNGRPYLRQLKTKSGIWFWDVRRKEPSDALPDWHSPEDLLARLEADIDSAHEQLETEPMDYLGLRYYQQEAIQAVEGAVKEQQNRTSSWTASRASTTSTT